MHEHNILSETEEMYLVTIHTICEHCSETPIPIPEIAKALGVQPVSVSQMVNKLTENGLVNYIPYKGVELTPEGRTISTRILRHRRLWEVFLVQSLSMDLESAGRLACQFEHSTTPNVANRLSHFLGNPTVSYRGDPIPGSDEGKDILFDGLQATHLQTGQSSTILRIDANPIVTKFLSDEGIRPGVKIRLLAVGENGDVLLEGPAGHLQISSELLSTMMVANIKKPEQNNLSKEQSMPIPLSELKVGEKGVVHKINFKGAIRQRFLAMGLVIGETILVKRVAPLGDPIDFVIKGYDLSLRKTEASEILVRPA